ncbi:MAG TPA: hypothetical protein DCE41_07295 [Cytophagales bacterium]|nr:hypothetical protein [Cytophagales bacterium]HAA19401.1 hypothetical protein [Cytophagales bacterium]HAP61274.1 hypothetical protein [Cytophagales bacterium]
MKFIEELKRLNVIKAAISYLAVSFALLDAADIVSPIMGLPAGFTRVLFIILAVLFPAWLIFAYIFEWTPQGFRKTDAVPEAQSEFKKTSRRLNHYIIAGLSVALLLMVVDRVFNVTGQMMEPTATVHTIAVMPFEHDSPSE